MNRNRTISLGDKIFARVSKNGQTIYNFVSEQVANMTDLVSQLRKAMWDIHGLVMIHIRNYNQGWGEERPLMLYARKERNYAQYMANITAPKRRSNSHPMFYPWDMH